MVLLVPEMTITVLGILSIYLSIYEGMEIVKGDAEVGLISNSFAVRGVGDGV